MPHGINIGVKGSLRNVTDGYVGVNGQPRKVKEGYVGVGGVPKLFYKSELQDGVFGVMWDMSQPSTKLTRLTSANDPNNLVTQNVFEEPTPAIGTIGGSSPFDTVMPWKGMEEYNVVGNKLIKTGDSQFSRNTNDTVVYIPEFGFKAIFEDTKIYYYISSKPTEDCPKHPGSGKYVGKYATGSGYYSKANLDPQVNMTRATARTSSANKGAGWSQWGFDTWCAIVSLYLVEWADWNSQTKIGKGYTDGSHDSAAINTGTTDSMIYHTGRASGDDGKTQVIYRWIEGLWGNVAQFVDGYNANERVPYICLDPSKYADDTDTNGYTELGVTLPESNGWIEKFGESKEFNWAFCISSVNSFLGPDYVYTSSSGWCVLLVSGGWFDGSIAGLLKFGVSSPSSDTYKSFGSRLQYIPPVAA